MILQGEPLFHRGLNIYGLFIVRSDRRDSRAIDRIGPWNSMGPVHGSMSVSCGNAQDHVSSSSESNEIVSRKLARGNPSITDHIRQAPFDQRVMSEVNGESIG